MAKSLVAMNRVLPARAYDSVLRRQYRLPTEGPRPGRSPSAR